MLMDNDDDHKEQLYAANLFLPTITKPLYSFAH